jgi:hypothetical protein
MSHNFSQKRGGKAWSNNSWTMGSLNKPRSKMAADVTPKVILNEKGISPTVASR